MRQEHLDPMVKASRFLLVAVTSAPIHQNAMWSMLKCVKNQHADGMRFVDRILKKNQKLISCYFPGEMDALACRLSDSTSWKCAVRCYWACSLLKNYKISSKMCQKVQKAS